MFKLRHAPHVYLASIAMLPFFLPLTWAVVEDWGSRWLWIAFGLVWAALAAVAGWKGYDMMSRESDGVIELNENETLVAQTMKSFCVQSFGFLLVLLVLVSFRSSIGW